jgi:hypothetical protein
MDAPTPIQNCVFVRIVGGSVTHQFFDQRSLTAKAVSRNDDRLASPTDNTSVNKTPVRRFLRHPKLHVCCEVAVKVFHVQRAAKPKVIGV